METPPALPPSRAPLIVLGLAFVFIIAGLLALIVFAIGQVAAPAPAPLSTPTASAAAPATTAAAASTAPNQVNRLAIIDADHIFTIDPGGSHRIDLSNSGQVPIAAVIWSHDGQRLTYTRTERGQTKLISARIDGSDERILFETDQLRAPFYLYGSPDDAHVAFLVPDPEQAMALRVADVAHPGSTQVIVTGQPNYSSWSPDGGSLIVHVGGARADAFVNAYALNNNPVQKVEVDPGGFQAPVWSPKGEHKYLYARHHNSRGQLVIGDGKDTTALAAFDDAVVFGWSPDGGHVAYAISTPQSFLYNGLTVVDLANQQSRVYYKGDVVSFFWSPDGQKLAFLTGALVEPAPVGRAPGLAAPPLARQQQRTLQLTWHVADLASGSVSDLSTFSPTESFLYLVQYFDQFAQSVAVWSPDSRALVYTGTPLVGERGIYVADTQRPGAAPRFVGSGDFAIWSWN